MMKSHFVKLLLLLLTLHLSSAWGQNPLIQTLCRKTDYYDECVKALQSDPRSLKADAKGLALIVLDIVTVKAKETLNHIGEAYRKAISPVLIRNYGTCILSYQRALDTDLKGAVEAVKSGSYATALSSLITTVESDYNPCENQFGPPPTKWKFSDETSLILKLTLVADSIIRTSG